tara:strand:- start:93 stop:635 length:543 start_codon:yes stop_codon:yes gene_type:complete
MISITKNSNPFRVTRKGLYYKSYFMYFSDTTHMYEELCNGTKKRVKMSEALVDGYYRHNYTALRDAIGSAKLLRVCPLFFGKKILEDIDASVGQIVIVREARRTYKIHIFKFYECGHVYYNQGVEGERGLLKHMFVFYRKFSQIYNSYGFGYQEYLDVARDLRDVYGTDETIVYDLGGAA